MSATATAAAPTTIRLSDADVAAYRRDGFTRVENVLTAEECAHYRAEGLRLALEESKSRGSAGYRKILRQRVNVWRDSDIMRELTLLPRVTSLATRLAGCPLRLWHDHLLVKDPRNGAATEFHQDQPYWPHATSAEPISVWIALQDVPVERGCMSFIPGSQRHTALSAQDLGNPRSLFEKCPELEWDRRVTLPLKAGSVTFHHGRTAHQAHANDTDEYRVAHVVIYMPRSTTYTGSGHVVTDGQGFEQGQVLAGALFPDV